MATPTHVVTRSFPGPGGLPLAPGAEVDASEWRNAAQLVEMRLIRPIEKPGVQISTPGPIDDAAIAAAGRFQSAPGAQPARGRRGGR